MKISGYEHSTESWIHKWCTEFRFSPVHKLRLEGKQAKTPVVVVVVSDHQGGLFIVLTALRR